MEQELQEAQTRYQLAHGYCMNDITVFKTGYAKSLDGLFRDFLELEKRSSSQRANVAQTSYDAIVAGN
jgi:hypothetical protein